VLRNIFISLRFPAAKIDECVYNIVAGRTRFGLRLLTPEPHCGCLQEKSTAHLATMKFWIMLILGLLVVSMSVNAAKDDKEGDKDDSNDSDASNDGNNSGAEDGDTSDSTGNLKKNEIYFIN
jgi:hypothetical protein